MNAIFANSKAICASLLVLDEYRFDIPVNRNIYSILSAGSAELAAAGVRGDETAKERFDDRQVRFDWRRPDRESSREGNRLESGRQACRGGRCLAHGCA